MDDVTGPLANRDPLPEHSASSNSRKIVKYGEVRDANNGQPLYAGVLHENEVRMLMIGQQMALGHLYAYAIRDGKIYHTRHAAVIAVQVVESGL